MLPVTEFRDTYVRLCKEHRVPPQDAVLHAIASAHKGSRKSGSGRLLNLATHSLTAQTCAVLSRVFTTDRCFTEINFNDCMIVEEGVRALANGFSTNVGCKKLDMKGNNIRGTAAEALGRMLAQNSCLLSLCLEWNGLGMLDAAFGVFCEGLATNTRLQVLDLRNNQITHDGATELAAMLKRNTTLRSLDLRWNNIGLIGGRHLLVALETNKTLVRLDLAGNNIPNDVLKAIETAVAHNGERAHLEADHHNRQSMMSKEIQDLKQTKTSEMSELLATLERQEAALHATKRSTNQKVNQLQDALAERREQFNLLMSKMSLLESELALSESKVNELATLLEKAKEQQVDAGKLHQAELKRLREDKAVMEGKMNKELISLNEKNMALSNKVDELERKNRAQQEQIFELKEQLSHAHSEYSLKMSHAEERVAMEKQKTKDAYRDADESRQKEVDRVKRESEETERMLKDRIGKLDQTRHDLDEEVSRLKNNLGEERLRGEEAVSAAKARCRAEEEQRVRALEDKLRLVTTARDELQQHAATSAANTQQLHAKNANLALENESLKRRIEDVNAELAGKNSEIMEEVGKVKIEMSQRIQKLEAERRTKAELYDKVSELEKQLADLQLQLATTGQAKDAEIARLTENVRQKEAALARQREEEQQRAQLLSTAVSNYCASAGKA